MLRESNTTICTGGVLTTEGFLRSIRDARAHYGTCVYVIAATFHIGYPIVILSVEMSPNRCG